jgi:hypothetical protein
MDDFDSFDDPWGDGNKKVSYESIFNNPFGTSVEPVEEVTEAIVESPVPVEPRALGDIENRSLFSSDIITPMKVDATQPFYQRENSFKDALIPTSVPIDEFNDPLQMHFESVPEERQPPKKAVVEATSSFIKEGMKL